MVVSAKIGGPQHISPYYRDPQKGIPNLGNPPHVSVLVSDMVGLRVRHGRKAAFFCFRAHVLAEKVPVVAAPS